ncbi:hypothetical protein JYT22_00815 [Endomicrobium sp. AH-315-J14]|nr:hypothetical protein [Endomicrobium sp. AH-315-J14]
MFFTPFTQTQQFMAGWKKMVDDHVTRVESMNEQYESATAQGHKRVGEAIDEYAKLLKGSLDYSQELSETWRTQSIEATKQAAKMMTPGL